MNPNSYVVLTGSKNNAGDFLIKYRAFSLFKKICPDKKIIDMDAWVPIDDNRLKIINQSKALILLGGPSLRRNMWPGIYPLVDDISKIKVPILTMGIGWKSEKGDWYTTHSYEFTKQTIKLLDRINQSGYVSSIRDYHSLNVLQA